jgi:histidine ammonia-lyase
MAIVLNGKGLTVEKLVRIARHGEKVEVPPEAWERIKVCRAMLEEKIVAKEIMYGVNTGIGEFSEVVLDDDQTEQFQRYLIYNHAAGIGDLAPIEYVRGAMAGRINVQVQGKSGCRPEIVETLVAMLNKGVTPAVCQKGSVGASGDLAPMSQIALLLTAMSAIHIYDMNRWLKQAEIACAMTLEALYANMKPYNALLHEVRGFTGALRTAKALRTCIEGSDLVSGKMKVKVQDAYSMRSTPQVIGAAHDAVAYAKSQVEIELNGIGDNPIFFPEHKLTLTGANFQGSPVGLPMDMAGVAITMVSVLSERRLNRLTNPALSIGLPPFLTKGAGMMSGMMLSQYTACTLIVEQKMLSAPASIGSIPAAADQEDFVSMAMNTAIKNGQILDNAYGVLGIEFMAAAQALDFRDFTPGKGVRKAHEVIRKHVAHLDEDRPLYSDHTIMQKVVRSCEILEAVETEIGSLE